jgi:hypothetical protein
MTKKTQKPTKKSQKKNSSSLPNNVSEEEFLQALENISKRLAHKFKFGYHGYDDIKQQAAIFALEGLEKYDNKRPLENFLWTHVRNRLFNYKRDNYQRPDKPCLNCPLYDPHCKKSTNQCEEYSNKNDCELYNSWETRNNSKKNIMKPIGMEDINETHSPNSFKDIPEMISNQQILDILDIHVNYQNRETYLKLKYGEKISKNDLSKFLLYIKDLLHDHGFQL